LSLELVGLNNAANPHEHRGFGVNADGGDAGLGLNRYQFLANFIGVFDVSEACW